MEVRPGYRQTEVGEVPLDWTEKEIGGFHPYVTSGSRGWAEYYSESGAPFIRITNLRRSSIYLDLDDLRFVKIPAGDSEGARTQLHNADILVSITADIGIVGYITDNVSKPSYINQHIALIRLDSSSVCPRFVSYFLASDRQQRMFRTLTDSGAKAGMNLTTVRQVRLSLPSTIQEQEAIAAALSDADALIESLEQLLAKKRQIKQGAMQELLTGKKRLPGFSMSDRYKQTEVGVIPEDWECSSIDTVIDEISMGPFGSDIKTSNFISAGVPVLNGANVASERLNDSCEHFVSIAKAKSLKKAVARRGDVVVTHRGTIGQISYIPEGSLFDRYVVSQSQFRARFKSGVVLPAWIALYFHSTSGARRLLEGKGHTGVPAIAAPTKTFRKLSVPLPQFPEQQAITDLLFSIDTLISSLENRLTKARQIKKGMMQELLTGRIRLVQPSEEVVPFPVKQIASAGTSGSHNPQINEAVVLAVLAHRFGSEQFPLGRFRRTKLSYLLHRHVERQVTGFLKKAAGPYSPQTRYGGAEKIALKNGYIRIHKAAKSEGFIAADNIAQAEGYFENWYGLQVLDWLKQFRYKKNEELELLTTVDMAIEDLRREGKNVTVPAVKQIIHDSPEWKAKLDRATFADSNITAAIESCRQLFPVEG
jgi:type I restriction enzyme, S subunit